jgi:hypothetical protein
LQLLPRHLDWSESTQTPTTPLREKPEQTSFQTGGHRPLFRPNSTFAPSLNQESSSVARHAYHSPTRMI